MLGVRDSSSDRCAVPFSVVLNNIRTVFVAMCGAHFALH